MAKKSRQEKLQLIKEIRKPTNMATDKEKIEEVEIVNDKDTSVDELVKEFEIPKISKEPTHDINSNDFETIHHTESKVNDKDFDTSKIEDKVNDFNTSNLLSAETSAEILVGTFDFTQEAILALIHQWKTRNKFESTEEYEEAKRIFKEVENGVRNIAELDISDKAKYKLLERVKSKVENLKFTTAEHKRLVDALVLVLRDMPQYKLQANHAIYFALIEVMGGRIIDVLVD